MKALALVDAPDHVCCRYRLRAFEPALSAAGWSIEYRALRSDPLGRWLQVARPPRVDAVVLQRKLLPIWQLRMLRSRSRRLIFDVDDAVLYRDSYDPRGPHSPRRARRFRAVVRAADLVVAGNDFLADCALRAGARADRVEVIPTCVQTDRYRPSERIRTEGSGLDLVWIGSSSTLQGLEASRALWDRLGREVPGVRLRVICDRFPDLGSMPVVAVPWTEASEAQALAEGDVGVALMPEGLWSRGKCGLKVVQYQAAGLPVLANPVGVHNEMVHPGVDGFLPGSTEEWLESVRLLAAHPDLRARMGRASRTSVESDYSVRAWEGAFVEALSGNGGGDPAGPSPSLHAGHPAHGFAIPRSLGPMNRAALDRSESAPVLERNGGVSA